MRKIVAAFATAMAVAAAAPAFADGVMVSDPWARASAGKARAGAAFMTIHNASNAGDRVVAAKSDIAERTELHTHLMDGGVMKMRQVEGIDVAAGAMVALQPGGYHVMFMGLKEALQEGATFPLTLVFDKAGEKTVTVHVMGPGAMNSGTMNHGSMKGH